MKLIIQVPCLNESATLGIALAKLPRLVEGFDSVEWLVIDDGSTDDTAQVALDHGVDHVVRHTHNMGLARAFMSGLDACLSLGADVIVNTDADDQYVANDIPCLTQPILDGHAEFVIGTRPIATIKHFSPLKKALQWVGSWVVRLASGTDVPDAPSGFRAMTRSVAQRLVVFGEYTYTLETIIQAGQKGMSMMSVPIHVNAELRTSRLVRSLSSYVRRSTVTIIRIFAIYRPFRFFGYIGLTFFVAGLIPGVRFLYKYASGEGEGHVQSLILAAILLGIGFQTILIAFVADLLSANRKLLEDIRYKAALARDRTSSLEDDA